MICLWYAVHGWLHHSLIWWVYLNQYIATQYIIPFKVWISTGTCTLPSFEGGEVLNQWTFFPFHMIKLEQLYSPTFYTALIYQNHYSLTHNEQGLTHFHHELWSVNFPWCFCNPEPLLHTQEKLLPCHTRATVPVSGCQHLKSLTSRRVNLDNFLPSFKEFLTRRQKEAYTGGIESYKATMRQGY